jgi:hypothetical protein
LYLCWVHNEDYSVLLATSITHRDKSVIVRRNYNRATCLILFVRVSDFGCAKQKNQHQQNKGEEQDEPRDIGVTARADEIEKPRPEHEE